jgi:hypothetical protein
VLAFVGAIASRIQLSAEPVCYSVVVIARTGRVLYTEQIGWRCVFVFVTVTMLIAMRCVGYAYRKGVLSESHASLRLIILGLTMASTLYLIGLHLADLSDINTRVEKQCAHEYEVVPGGRMVVMACAFVVSVGTGLAAFFAVRHWCEVNGHWVRHATNRIVLDHRLYGL